MHQILGFSEGTTEYLIAHESYHAEEMSILGFDEFVKDAALKGTEFPGEYSDASLRRSYNREKYVHDRVVQNAKKHGLNDEELWHNFLNLEFYIGHLEKRGLQIPD